MGIHLIAMLVEEKILSEEISRLSKILPPEKLDSPETQFHEGLFYEPESDRNQYAYAKFEPYKNAMWCSDADLLRFQILIKARETDAGDGTTERHAEILFQFFGTFFCSFTRSNPFNEFGFKNSVIIHPSNARRLHSLFQQIDFDLLCPIFDVYCQQKNDGEKYGWIRSFRELVDYANALDGLLFQAIETGNTLYIYAG